MMLCVDGLYAMFASAARLWERNVDRLSEIDSKFGDGDHGVAAGKIAALLSRAPAPGATPRAYVEGLAAAVMGMGGGSAGPLYGTLLEGMASALPEGGGDPGGDPSGDPSGDPGGDPSGDLGDAARCGDNPGGDPGDAARGSGNGSNGAETLRRMILGARDAMFDVTKARAGSKTMMDALIPAAGAVEALDAAALAGRAPAEAVRAVLEAAARAAAEGAERTRGMAAKFGRARSYGERTLGTMDAGALSCALFFEGLWEWAKEGPAT
jgi:dihydroxyacetone kinase-like protein